MKIFNTLSQKKEEFEPIFEKTVRMYTCGPTVYDIAHIGNLRKYICDDLLYRSLIANGYKVKRVMNITDVDDKTIGRAKGRLEAFKKLTSEYEKLFLNNLEALNILLPDVITRATAYVDKMVQFILDLEKKGFAYRAPDGSTYFSIKKFKDYGRLSKIENQELLVGARVNQDEYDKENPADFALWKAWDESDGEIFWETELGKGRPGWHIECSTMSMDTLGETMDIHTGGVDNIFPHHENEIAQSEAKTGKKFVNFWVHNEHLLVDGKKMSKSLGNVYNLGDIEAKGFNPLDFRYLIIGSHYRSKMNFTWNALEAAKNAREKLINFAQSISGEKSELCQIYDKKFMSKINDDLNMPEALAIVWELVKDEKKSMAKKKGTLKKWDEEILGLDLFKALEIPKEIVNLAEERKSAREKKDYQKSDELRDKIADRGWLVEDLKENDFRITRK